MCKGHLFRLVLKGKYKNKKDGSITPEYLIANSEEEIVKKMNANTNSKFIIEQIPCGVCWECRMKNASEWAFRCMKEAKYHENNLMITLTYDEEHLPKGIKPIKIDEETGEVLEYELSSTLWKREHQLFMKKLRKWWDKEIVPEDRPEKKRRTDFETKEEWEEHKKIYNKFWNKWSLKYRLCGEYGSDAEYKDFKGNIKKGTKRPHFHAIIFGLKLDDMKFYKYSFCEWDKDKKNKLYKSKTLDKIWSKGLALANEVNYNTCCYVSRYIMKKQLGKGAKKQYEEEGRVPEYSASSNRPGIGNQYFEDNIEKFLNDEKHFVNTNKGVKEFGHIRYYDKLLEKMYPDKFEEIKLKRKKRSAEIIKNILNNTDISESQYVNNHGRKYEKKLQKLIRPLA